MTESHRAPRSTSGLPAPVKDVIDASLSEADVQRLWRDLQSKPARPSRARSMVIAAGFGLALSVGAALLLWLPRGAAPHAAGPLALVGADATRSGLGAAQAFGGADPQRLSLDDGSRVELGRSARFEVVANTGSAFATRLRAGRGEFEVKPGGPRRWSIDCGAVTVEVVGTHFAIERSERGVRVEVARGVVRVRGAGVARELVAGESVYVAAETEAKAETGIGIGPGPGIGIGPGIGNGVGPGSGRGRAVVEAGSAVPAGQDAELLLRQADDARRAGQRERAAELLERVVRQAPSSPHAALAALTLARLVMTDEPARAARALAAVRDSAASSGVREDLMARLVEARAREGRGDLAREAADQYIRDFPHGTRLDEVRQWASAPRP